MSDTSETPIYDELVQEHGELDEEGYIKQVESLPDDEAPETMDDYAVQSDQDDHADGNNTPNGGI